MATVSMDVFSTCVDAVKRSGRPAKVFKWDSKVPLYIFLELDKPVDGAKREILFSYKMAGFGDTKVEACVSAVHYAHSTGAELVKLVNSSNLSEKEIRRIFEHDDHRCEGDIITYCKIKAREAKNA